MSRRAASFTQSDVARIMRAAEQVAPGRWRVRVNRQGEIILEPVVATQADLSPISTGQETPAPVALLREPQV